MKTEWKCGNEIFSQNWIAIYAILFNQIETILSNCHLYWLDRYTAFKKMTKMRYSVAQNPRVSTRLCTQSALVTKIDIERAETNLQIWKLMDSLSFMNIRTKTHTRTHTYTQIHTNTHTQTHARTHVLTDAEGFFTIDPIRGVIKTARQIDREMAEFFEIIVQAQDHGRPKLAG